MFRRIGCDGQLSERQSSSSLAGHGVPSPGSVSQESSWIDLLSRPASTFLQKYLPGRTRPSPRGQTRVDWIGGGFKSFGKSEFLEPLDDVMPPPQHAARHLSYLACPRGGAEALLETPGGCSGPWLTSGSLAELGIQSVEELNVNVCQPGRTGSLSPSRTLLSHVWFSSGWIDWEMVVSPVKSSGGRSRRWWGSLLGAAGSPARGPAAGLLDYTKGHAGETTAVIVQRSSNGGCWTQGENSGQADHKELVDVGGLQTPPNREESNPDQLITTKKHLSGVEAAPTSREEAPTSKEEAPTSKEEAPTSKEEAPTSPDQDNGSSLEEEAPSEDQETRSTKTIKVGMEEETSEEGGSMSEGPAEVPLLNTPQCQNKTIAFIMGCPCSDDDSSQSDESSDDDDDDDDDDGFDSECSSDSTEEDEDDDDDEMSDSEGDSEVERLWSSFCQSVDPYNPRNFTAGLNTSTTPPSSTKSSPASPPSLTPLPRSSPPTDQDVWEDWTSASEVDESENVRLWSSFSCSSDPYNPLNFQASLRTEGSTEAGPRGVRAKKTLPIPLGSSHPAPPPEHVKEEAEERLDSGFSEPTTSSRSCTSSKKVRFQDDVEEFFISCGEEKEDRRGPWEELARDRYRFLRRCQEVEQSIAYCLQPEHRHLAYHRLTVLWVQDRQLSSGSRTINCPLIQDRQLSSGSRTVNCPLIQDCQLSSGSRTVNCPLIQDCQLSSGSRTVNCPLIQDRQLSSDPGPSTVL